MSKTLTSIRLDAADVTLGRSGLPRLLGATDVSVPYLDIQGVTMAEPQGLRRGRLVLCRIGQEDITVPFGLRELAQMRRTRREIWRRVEVARANAQPE